MQVKTAEQRQEEGWRAAVAEAEANLNKAVDGVYDAEIAIDEANESLRKAQEIEEEAKDEWSRAVDNLSTWLADSVQER